MERPLTERPYRKNVAAVVIDESGRILACRRSDFDTTWQLPQGGMEKGETPEAALLRELKEEIGTNEVDVIGRLPEPIYYEWPPEVAHKKYRGQEQIYFLVRLRENAAISLLGGDSPEFDLTEWLTTNEFIGRLEKNGRGSFKYAAYLKALEQLHLVFPGVIAK